jgi:hypothetical protein
MPGGLDDPLDGMPALRVVDPKGSGNGAAETAARWCQALSQKDFDGMMALLDPAAVLYTPVTDQFSLVGHAEIAALVHSVLTNVDDFDFYLNVGTDYRRVVGFHGRTKNFQFEEFQSLRINDENLIDELVLAVRPLAGVTAVLYGVGVGLLVANRSPRWRRLFRPLLGAVAHAARLADRKVLLLAAPPLTNGSSGNGAENRFRYG